MFKLMHRVSPTERIYQQGCSDPSANARPIPVSMQEEPVAPVALFVGADVKYMMEFRGALIEACQAKGYRTIVLATPVPGFNDDQLLERGIQFVPWRLSKSSLNPVRDLSALHDLWSTLRACRCSLVFAHTIKSVIYTMILSRLAGVPRRAAMIPGLGYAFTDGYGIRRRLVSTIAWAAYALAFRASSIVLFQNEDDRADLRANGALSPKTPTAVVDGSGIDMERFPAITLPGGAPTFLMVARLIRDKGVHDYVDAARLVRQQIPEARFVLVGAPDANPEAVTQAEITAWLSEGLIEVRGHLSDPQPEYAACHVFVLPSYYREGTPRTNLEAMATGRAVITTDAPGCRETVTHGVNGLLVPPRDSVALAEAMISLARDPERVRKMGLAGTLICAQRFELAKVTHSTLAHIEGESGGAPTGGDPRRSPPNYRVGASTTTPEKATVAANAHPADGTSPVSSR